MMFVAFVEFVADLVFLGASLALVPDFTMNETVLEFTTRTLEDRIIVNATEVYLPRGTSRRGTVFELWCLAEHRGECQFVEARTR